ncbi:MAG TPA: helical backbone metal receptor [Candidatus Polarisedimenticolaceae bacterium]
MRRLPAFAVAFALALLAGCGPNAPGPPTGAHPQRIVSLSPALTEILFALGLGDRVAGVTSFCDWPPEAREKAKVGGYADPSVETILGLRPDLVIVSPGPGNRDAALVIERAGIRVQVVPAETLDETFAAFRLVADAAGVPERGAALAAEVRSRLDAVAARVAGAPKVRALFCVQTDPVIVAGAATLPSELLEIAGGVNVVPLPRYPRLGVETLLELAPEAILQSRMDAPEPGSEGSEAAFWRRWSSIPAVRDGRVYVLENPLALRPGPRVGVAAEQLAALLHPVAGDAR